MPTNLLEKGARSRAVQYRPAFTVGELNYVAESLELFARCSDWIGSYLAQPHAQLGRTGSVCPFAAPAMAKDTLRVAVVRLGAAVDGRTQIRNAIEHYREAFIKLVNTEASHMLHSILVLFPDVRLEDAPDLIDSTKEELKASFVDQGLMLGEFHADNNSPGLHNPAFAPLRSPIPMLAIRRMVATDLIFLNREEYDAPTRLRFLETYLRVSGMPDSNARKELEGAVAALKAELQSAA